MRLRERDKRAVTVYSPAGMDDDVYRWGEGQRIRACVYPMGESLHAQTSGERMAETRLMLYDGGVKLAVGMGVALEEGAPAFRIAALEAWAHVRATLERIGEGRSALD